MKVAANDTHIPVCASFDAVFHDGVTSASGVRPR